MLLSDQDISDIVDDVVETSMKDYEKVINYTNDEMYKEAVDMYNSFIQQFYNYETTSYIRYGQSRPGTRKGMDLYYPGRGIKKRRGKNPTLDIDFSTELMEDHFQHDSSEMVFELVMMGFRFPYYNMMTWNGSYHGNYFSFSGTPTDAFEEFEDRFDDIAEKIFFAEWEKLGY